MVLSAPIRQQNEKGYIRRGRKNGCKATIAYSTEYAYFYFYILDVKSKNTYNSLWEKISFQDEAVCRIACEKQIDVMVQQRNSLAIQQKDDD